ncbi:hypothetical protein GN109_06035 [Collimonas pratensis]|uniref:SGNH/GDSL hydrolase family protein n=1 Tax=Collimonas pratensis TaxID=279113 RepID=UPI00143D84F7|nr:SGNH/GDSL hydrolase family protein [Collimonas pratensis]NKI68973.1 hypothetical protein [Collimonas pratensis]
MTIPIDLSKFSVADPVASAAMVLSAGVQNWHWTGVINNEPILPLVAGQRFQLWKPAISVQSVKNPITGTVYVAGVDYALDVFGNLFLPAGSAIPLAPGGAAYPYTAVQNSQFASQQQTKSGSPLRISEDFLAYQIHVSYTAAPINVPSCPAASNRPIAMLNMLGAGQPVAISLLGDSIGKEGSSSFEANYPPYQHGFFPQLVAYMTMKWPGQIYSRNQAIIGYDSYDVATYLGNFIADSSSNFMILEFGMNDGTPNRSKADFKANLESVIKNVRANSPNTEFALIAGITSNPEWIDWAPRFLEYRDAMLELSGQYGTKGQPVVCVIDVTSRWLDALTRKSYFDMTGDGANHPGDFGHTMYVQTLIQGLFGNPP